MSQETGLLKAPFPSALTATNALGEKKYTAVAGKELRLEFTIDPDDSYGAYLWLLIEGDPKPSSVSELQGSGQPLMPGSTFRRTLWGTKSGPKTAVLYYTRKDASNDATIRPSATIHELPPGVDPNA
ncbi:MAG: hypothetical protein HUU29_00280 [Planctomycetaceae bacterium]|nr:hypothetical protein [Planctomycetaceae bacterium]